MFGGRVNLHSIEDSSFIFSTMSMVICNMLMIWEKDIVNAMFDFVSLICFIYVLASSIVRMLIICRKSYTHPEDSALESVLGIIHLIIVFLCMGYISAGFDFEAVGIKKETYEIMTSVAYMLLISQRLMLFPGSENNKYKIFTQFLAVFIVGTSIAVYIVNQKKNCIPHAYALSGFMLALVSLAVGNASQDTTPRGNFAPLIIIIAIFGARGLKHHTLDTV